MPRSATEVIGEAKAVLLFPPPPPLSPTLSSITMVRKGVGELEGEALASELPSWDYLSDVCIDNYRQDRSHRARCYEVVQDVQILRHSNYSFVQPMTSLVPHKFVTSIICTV